MTAIGSYLIICRECGEGNRIHGKCIKCDILMCEKCCLNHQMFELNLSDQHKIVGVAAAIGQPSKENVGNSLVQAEIQCDVHKGYPYRGYCTNVNCETVVCDICISQIHYNHIIDEIDVGLQLSLYKLKCHSSKVGGDIIGLFRHLSTVKTLKREEYNNLEKVKQEIIKHDKYLKDAIDARTKVLTAELARRWHTVNKSLEEEENKIEILGKQLEERNAGITAVLESNDASQVFRSVKEILNYEDPMKLFNTKLTSLPQFVPGKVTQCIVESIHGSLLTIEQKQASTEINLKPEEVYNTGLTNVDNILCLQDGSTLINSKSSSDSETGELQHVKLFNQSVDLKNKFIVDFGSMALLPSGELIVSTEESELEKLSSDKKNLEKTSYSVSPFVTTRALHISEDKLIIVGAKEKYYQSGEAKLVVMDLAGKTLSNHDLDNNKKRLFKNKPTRVTSDANNLYVTDTDGIIKGRIIILNRSGGVRGIYTSSDTDFIPKDLVITKSGKLVVCCRDRLHILNNDGLCIKIIKCGRDLGLWDLVMSSAVDVRGFLLLGCNKAHDKKYTAKIHVLAVNEV